MKSPPATTTTMTTWCHRDVLLMRRPIFWLVYSLKNAPLHIRWFISFEKQAPYYLVLYFELWKQKSKNSVTKGSPPVRKPLADFFNCLVENCTTSNWKLTFGKFWKITGNPSKYFDIQIGSFYFRGFIFYLWKQRAKNSDSL